MGLERTQELLIAEFDIGNMSILWSGALLVPAIVLYAIHSPTARDARRMAAWMASAALLHRYSASSETTLDEDLRACGKPDPLEMLFRNLRRSIQVRKITAVAEDFAGTFMDRGALFATYIALHHSGARDIVTGQKVTLMGARTLLHRHHIWPKAGFAKNDRRDADRIANLAFLLQDANQSLGKEQPAKYLPRLDRKYVRSQCIPLEESAYTTYEEFCKKRRKALAEAFNSFLNDARAK